jgi:ParB family transcriptional regulator, chromosome partitioning protein
VNTEPKSAPAEGVLLVQLESLFLDPRNPRAQLDAEDVDALAANVEALGLLAPLLCVTKPNGFAVVDGRRRLAALTRLAQQGRWAQPVPVLFVADDEVESVALAANTQRVALSPAAEARAFAAAVEAHGQTGEQVARVFGCTVRHVEQRLKLAALHPPVFAALEAGEIALDVARAYASADTSLQAATWDKLGAGAAAFAVKQQLEKKALPATAAVARLVGEAAYVAAGGRVERDLFDEDGEGALWLDRKLAEQLADARLAEERARVEAEGWAEVTTRKGHPGYGSHRDATPKKRKPTEEEKAALDAVDKELKAKRKTLYSQDLGEAAYDALDRDVDALAAKKAALEAALEEWPAKTKATHGAVVWLDDSGALQVKRGVAPKEKTDAKASAQGASATQGGAPPAGKQKAAPREEPAFSADARRELESVACAHAKRTLAARPHLALVALVSDLAVNFVDGAASVSVGFTSLEPNFGGFGADPPKGVALDTGAWSTHQAAFAGWRDRVRTVVGKKRGVTARAALVAELVTWSESELVKLLAACVAADLSFWNGVDSDDADLWGALLAGPQDPGEEQLHPAALWSPSLAWCKGLSESALRSACEEQGVAAPAKASKAELAARVADTAKETGWLPPLLRTFAGVRFETRAAPEEDTPGAPAPKKRGRPPKLKADAITLRNAPVIGGDAVSLTSPVDPPAKKKPGPKPGAKKVAKKAAKKAPKKKVVARKSAPKARKAAPKAAKAAVTP